MYLSFKLKQDFETRVSRPNFRDHTHVSRCALHLNGTESLGVLIGLTFGYALIIGFGAADFETVYVFIPPY